MHGYLELVIIRQRIIISKYIESHQVQIKSFSIKSWKKKLIEEEIISNSNTRVYNLLKDKKLIDSAMLQIEQGILDCVG